MSWLFPRLRQHLCRTRGLGEIRTRRLSSISSGDETPLEEDVERKVGYAFKFLFVGTAVFFGYRFVPYMGDNLLQQSVQLLHVKDPLFKRMGASRLTRFAADDEKRMRVVEVGGAEQLLKMLEMAKDDKTRKSALKALAALARSEEVAGILHGAGAVAVVASTPNSQECAEVESYKSNLLKRFQDLKYDTSLSDSELSY